MATMRLDRLLANLGYGSRREIIYLTIQGVIELDGEPVKRSDMKITVTDDIRDRLLVEGEKIDPPAPLTVILHKPLDVVCSHKEAGMRIYDLLPARWQRRDPTLSSVGRLDKDSSGLLLLTDDGQLLHKIISPKSHVAKRYHVTLDRPLKGDEAAIFASGTLMLEGEETPLLPAVFVPVDDKTGYVTITEGRYHQVRRMFAAIGNHVLALHRDKVGGLTLPADLPPGEIRILNKDDIAQIFAKD
jgi:16S rRNA pseudouridine516 synthase